MRSKAKPIDADLLDLGKPADLDFGDYPDFDFSDLPALDLSEFATMTLDFDLDMTFDLALDDMPEFVISEKDLQWMPTELQEGPLDDER